MVEYIPYQKSQICVTIGSIHQSTAPAVMFPIGSTELLKDLPRGFYLRQSLAKQPENFAEEYELMRDRFNKGQFSKAQQVLRNRPFNTEEPYRVIDVEGEGKTERLFLAVYNTERISENNQLNGNIAHAQTQLLTMGCLENAFTEGIGEIALPVIPYFTDKESKEHRITISESAKYSANAVKRFIDDYDAKMIIQLHLPFFKSTETKSTQELLQSSLDEILRAFK